MSEIHVRPLAAGTRARVVAVVRALRLDEVVAQLATLGPRDLLIEEVRGYGRQKGHLDEYAGATFHEGGFLPKVRLEFTIDGGRLPEAVDALCRGARTGRIGDGKIFVHPVETQGTSR